MVEIGKSEIYIMLVLMFMGLLFNVIIQGMFNIGQRVDQVTNDIAVIKFCLEHDISHCS